MFTDFPCKRGPVFAVLDARGMAEPGAPRVSGVLMHDARHLSTYAWRLPGFELLHDEPRPDGRTQFWSRFAAHEQDLLIRRVLTLRPDGLDDLLEVTNESLEPQSFAPRLDLAADFRDVFELRGRTRGIPYDPPAVEETPGGWRAAYVAQDGVRVETRVALEGLRPGEGLTLAPGETRRVGARAAFASDLPGGGEAAIPWTDAALAARAEAGPALACAFADVDMLALATRHGPVLAAGVPNYVCPFGRDGLIAAWFLLDAAPGLAEGVLRQLAAHRGTAFEPGRDEEPGRIPHELRVGELSRTGDVPFARYYGTADANALFLRLLADHMAVAGPALARELEPAWRDALAWTLGARDADGLLRYDTGRMGRGLSHRSWKDSDDGVSDSAGRLPEGPLAVVEIQGYLAAALDAAAALEGACAPRGAGQADRLRAEAAAMRRAVERFWHEGLGLHAIALDAEGRPCDTATSNPGHLLWARALDPGRAEAVARRLMRDDLWTGWGLRTLSSEAPRHKPLSYHNGSVWPHDTALFAAGLRAYGMHDRAERVLEALTALAGTQPEARLPELFGGYPRGGPVPPLPYLETCRPQAWSAAGLIHLAMAGGPTGAR